MDSRFKDHWTKRTFEKKFSNLVDKVYTLSTMTKFFIPIAAIGLLIVSLKLVFGYEKFLGALSMISLELFSPFSFELSAPFGATIGLDIFSIIFILAFVNIFASLFIIWNFGLIRHLPKIGKYLGKFDKKMRLFIIKHSLEHVSLFGLFLYYLSPFQASGAVTIAILGRLLNIDTKKIIAIIILGTVIGVLIFASPIYGAKSLFGF